MNTKITALLVAALFCLFSSAHAEEIITLKTMTVTANKTEENTQEVSGSLTVFSGDEVNDLKMEGISDISNFTPNFTIIEAGASGYNMPSMRGMFAEIHSHTVAVGLYVDGVPILDGMGYEQALIDAERIEILKGPQGTLYGKGSEAGIINIITHTPDSEAQGQVSAELGIDNKIKAEGTFSGPIIQDKFYAGLSILHEQKDGWLENTSGDTIDDLKQDYVAAKLRFTPTGDLDITLSGTYLKYDNGQQHMNLTELGASQYGLSAPGDRVVSSTLYGYDKTDTTALTLKVEYRLSDTLKLSSVTSNRKYSVDNLQDYDFAQPEYFHYRSQLETTRYSEELRLSSTNTPIKWVVGIYTDTDEIENKYSSSSIYPSMIMAIDDAVNEGTSRSAFSHINVPIGDFSVLGGIRYDYQEREFNQPSYGISLEDTWSEVSPKIGAEYRVSKEMMTYATVSKGYLPGGFNSYAAYAGKSQYMSFDEEKLWSYEIGIKNTLLNNRLILNVSAFYMDITDAQVQEYVNTTSNYTTNAAEVSSKGFEIETIYKPMHGLIMTAGFGYVEARFDDFSDALGNYEGNRRPYTPDYTFNIGATYRVSSGFYYGADVVGTGNMYTDKANEYKRDAYALINVKVGYETEHYDIYLYGKNILDEEYDLPYDEGMYVIYSPPAEFGVTFAARF